MKTAQRGRTRTLPKVGQPPTLETVITVGRLVELLAPTMLLPALSAGSTTDRPRRAYLVLPGARVRVNGQANERRSDQAHDAPLLLIPRRATAPVCIDLSLTRGSPRAKHRA